MNERAELMNRTAPKIADDSDDGVLPAIHRTKSNLHAPKQIWKAVLEARAAFDRLKCESADGLNERI